MPSDDVGSRDSLIAPFVRSLALTRRGALWQALAGAGLATAGGLLLPAGAALAQAADGESKVPDWDVPGGHFYTQTAPPDAPADSGYLVADAGEVPFWREFRNLGGTAQLGFPLSARYDEGPNTYQVMQVGIMRRSGDTGQVDLHPVFVAFAEMGMDDWLQTRGVPATAPALRQNPDLPVETRLSWFTQPAIRAAWAFAGEDTARARYGLPMSEPQRFGPFISQRFERATLQLWLDAVPDQPAPGTVTTVQAGELLKEAKLIPDPALATIAPPAPRPVVQAPRPPVVPAVQGPEAPGPGRQVVVSLGRQWWWAYQDGAVVFNGPVTTGMPELSTPTGRFNIFARFSPYTMHSPWPRSSPYWYEPSSMTYAMQITGNGVFLHDAPWRPYYGPGTNVWHNDPDGVRRTGSHGCINLPFGAAQFLWNWAPMGTAVLVTG